MVIYQGVTCKFDQIKYQKKKRIKNEKEKKLEGKGKGKERKMERIYLINK